MIPPILVIPKTVPVLLIGVLTQAKRTENLETSLHAPKASESPIGLRNLKQQTASVDKSNHDAISTSSLTSQRSSSPPLAQQSSSPPQTQQQPGEVPPVKTVDAQTQNKFEFRTLDKAGKMKVSTLGLGCLHIGEAFDDVAASEALKVVKCAHDFGIRHFDTAPWYGCGCSESRLGVALHDIRRNYADSNKNDGDKNDGNKNDGNKNDETNKNDGNPKDGDKNDGNKKNDHTNNNNNDDESKTEFTISTKISKQLNAEPKPNPVTDRDGPWHGGYNLKVSFDYGAEGIKQQHRESCLRLGVPRVDALVIHDLDTSGQCISVDKHLKELLGPDAKLITKSTKTEKKENLIPSGKQKTEKKANTQEEVSVLKFPQEASRRGFFGSNFFGKLYDGVMSVAIKILSYALPLSALSAAGGHGDNCQTVSLVNSGEATNFLGSSTTSSSSSSSFTSNSSTDKTGIDTLRELKSSGKIHAVGIGCNQSKWSTVEVCETIMKHKKADGVIDFILMAGPYTLLNHEALDSLLPLCEEKGVKVLIGAPYASGILAGNGNNKYMYSEASKDSEIVQRVKRIEDVCKKYTNVTLKSAALQFPLLHPMVSSVIPGTKTVKEVEEAVEAFKVEIPQEFWEELKKEKLIDSRCPIVKKENFLKSFLQL